MDQNVMRRTRRIGLMAGAVALLLQIVAWAWMPAWIAPANAAEGGGIVICSPEGFKTIAAEVAWNGQGAPASPETGKTDPLKAAGTCPLCPLIAGLALPPPVALAMPADPGRHGSARLPGARIAAGWFLSTLQARAPPSVG